MHLFRHPGHAFEGVAFPEEPHSRALALPNVALQRTGRTQGDVHVLGSVEGYRQFPRPPLNPVR